MAYSFTQLEKESLCQPLIRKLKKGEYLFQQGQPGNSFFIVLEGNIHLIQESEEGEHVFARVEADGVLGEKSLLEGTKRHRYFSALADSDVRLLELTLDDLKQLVSQQPQLLFEIMKRCLEETIDRLDRANYLAKCLRGSQTEERFKKCLVYLAQTVGVKKKGGILIPSLRSALMYYLGLPEAELIKMLENAIKNKVLLPDTDQDFFLSSETGWL